MSDERERHEEEAELSWEAQEALEDPEGPQACDLVEDDETDTVPCPNCGDPVPDLADKCPYCGEWITQGGEEVRVSERGLLWFGIILVVVLGLVFYLL